MNVMTLIKFFLIVKDTINLRSVRMKFVEFMNKYLGKKVDFDGVYGAQCVDLFRQYCKDVLNIKEHTGAVDGAKDLYLNYVDLPNEHKYFNLYKSNFKYGDALVWGASMTNKYGHVAIYICDLGNGTVLVMEQDGFKQDGAKLAVRSKSNLLGALRLNKEVSV